ncbi:hypothetical protein L227DRAFT_390534 [Lentinus tigrinus ALCF2SS1-6]|uniref:Uncharacterized protein n=1 Tax=Lentinus tigrinus ALCF2SS1-6 TaxID=1328759 RepID=A0A5C2SIE1_9APHY|nr:hypothetical protein L227DRAFT_390534 [Lentinus tigrinus ALCF2SS1-6]
MTPLSSSDSLLSCRSRIPRKHTTVRTHMLRHSPVPSQRPTQTNFDIGHPAKHPANRHLRMTRGHCQTDRSARKTPLARGPFNGAPKPELKNKQKRHEGEARPRLRYKKRCTCIGQHDNQH